MSAIDKLARKLGFVRPGRYGLVHTPDDRILSLRPTVLDDGIGGKIVGWLESDLAAMEFDRWASPKQALVVSAARSSWAPPASASCRSRRSSSRLRHRRPRPRPCLRRRPRSCAN